MKLLYVTNSRLPTNKAHGVQIAKMCEAMIESGIGLKLIIPQRKNSIKESIREYYGLRVSIPTKKLWTLDLYGIIPDVFAYPLESLLFYFQIFLLTFTTPKEVIFTRDHYSPLFCFNKSRVVWEVHELPKTLLGHLLVAILAVRCKIIIAPNKAVEKYFRKRGLANQKVIYLPNAVDTQMFSIKESPASARKRLNLPSNNKLVGYTGSFYQRKGIDTLLRAAKYLAPSTKVAAFGGPEAEFQRLAKLSRKLKVEEKLLLFPTVPYQQVPFILRAMDILVIPNSSQETLSREQTSPLKFREYLASGKPIVASDVASLRELDPKNNQVQYFSPDNPRSLASAILGALKVKSKYAVDEDISLKKRVELIAIKLQ